MTAVVAVIFLQHPNGTSGGTHTITVQSADTKAAWMTVVQTAFNAAGLRLSNGDRAAVFVSSIGATGAQDGSLDGAFLQRDIAPTMWSPPSTDFVSLQEAKDGAAYVKNRSQSCRRYGGQRLEKKKRVGNTHFITLRCATFDAVARRSTPSASPCGATGRRRWAGLIGPSPFPLSYPWCSTRQLGGGRLVRSSLTGAAYALATATPSPPTPVVSSA